MRPEQTHEKATATRTRENKLMVDAPWLQYNRVQTIHPISHIPRPNVPDEEGHGPPRRKNTVRVWNLRLPNKYGHRLDDRRYRGSNCSGT